MPTALPAATDYTSSSATEGQHKTFMAAFRQHVADLLGVTGTQASALTALGAPLCNVVAKTAAYTVVAADRGKVLDCTNTWTLSLTAAATLGDGFVFAVKNSGVGVITIDPNAAETVDGAATLALAAGESCLVVCTGTAFRLVGRAASTASNLAGGAAGSMPYQAAANTTAMLAAGTSGQLLQSNGAAAPSWVTLGATAVGGATAGLSLGAIGSYGIMVSYTFLTVGSTGAGPGAGTWRYMYQVFNPSSSEYYVLCLRIS